MFNGSLFLFVSPCRVLGLDESIEYRGTLEVLVISLELEPSILQSHDKCGARGTELDVMRNEDEGSVFHELALETLMVKMVSCVRVNGTKDVIEE